MRTRVIALLALVASAGCFVSAAKVMDDWVGSPEPELVQKWGAPDRSYALADGSRVLTYREGVRCERSFTVSPRGVVTAWSATPDCPKEFRK